MGKIIFIIILLFAGCLNNNAPPINQERKFKEIFFENQLESKEENQSLDGGEYILKKDEDSISSIPCSELYSLWKKFVEEHKDCKKAEIGCAMGGYIKERERSCLFFLGKFGGDAISANFLEQAEKYIDRFLSDDCQELKKQAECTFDVIVSFPVCVQNKCVER